MGKSFITPSHSVTGKLVTGGIAQKVPGTVQGSVVNDPNIGGVPGNLGQTAGSTLNGVTSSLPLPTKREFVLEANENPNGENSEDVDQDVFRECQKWIHGGGSREARRYSCYGEHNMSNMSRR